MSELQPPRPLSPYAEAALAALAFQVELGATEAIGDVPVDRLSPAHAAVADSTVAPMARDHDAVVASPRSGPTAVSDGPGGGGPDVVPGAAADGLAEAVAAAEAAARMAGSLSELAAAMAAYGHCALRNGARNCVFADGRPDARVMVIGEAPGREEDLAGLPFVGRAGHLLDRMFAAIGMARGAPETERAVYITNVLPWRPPQNRRPERAEIRMMLPFLLRHIELAAPEVLVLMGNTPCLALMGQDGITRLRGRWVEVAGRPALPSFHPAYLLRTPSAKREAWADLLALQGRLRDGDKGSGAGERSRT